MSKSASFSGRRASRAASPGMMYRFDPNSAEPQEQAGSKMLRESCAIPLPRLLCCLAGPKLRAKGLQVLVRPSPWLAAFNLRPGMGSTAPFPYGLD